MVDYKPAAMMVGLQFVSASVVLFTRTILVNGLSPRVFVVYRQGIAALTMGPIAFFSRSNALLNLSLLASGTLNNQGLLKKSGLVTNSSSKLDAILSNQSSDMSTLVMQSDSDEFIIAVHNRCCNSVGFHFSNPFHYQHVDKSSSSSSLGIKSFGWLLAASLFGVTANQVAYFEGLYLSSSTVASSMTNIMPAITFVMAFIAGWEKFNIGSLRSLAKILGTVFCVSGAIAMALFKGPKLLNAEFIAPKSLLFSLGAEKWLLGCLLLFAGAWFWSLWLILLVPIAKIFPDHSVSSAWMCLLASLEAAVVALFADRTVDAWTLHSFMELTCCLYSGIGLAVFFFVQAWCISKRGPLFCSMFNPLCTIIVTIYAGLFQREEIYTGSLISAFAVIIGLYIVLWGKAKDNEEKKQETDYSELQDEQTRNVQVIIGPVEKKSCKSDFEELLLSSK